MATSRTSITAIAGPPASHPDPARPRPISAPSSLTLRVQGYRPPPGRPRSLTVTVNGAWQTAVPLTTTMQAYMLGPIMGIPPAEALVVTLDSPTFRPAGDPRDLGVKVDRVTVGLAGPAPLSGRRAGCSARGIVAILGLFALLWRLLGGQVAGVQLAGAVAGGATGPGRWCSAGCWARDC